MLTEAEWFMGNVGILFPAEDVINYTATSGMREK